MTLDVVTSALERVLFIGLEGHIFVNCFTTDESVSLLSGGHVYLCHSWTQALQTHLQ